MKRLVPVFVLMLAATVWGSSEETWKGVALIDTMCSAKVKDKPDSHTVSCALACERGGYGIVAADGTYLKFDAAGNKKAIAALKATKQTDHLRATVVGERDGETIKVKALSLD